uniref:Uncharacterized protein n=1 Tax=Helianthus annuus TaxID=4232 RepID=A0A251TVI1_HELAN
MVDCISLGHISVRAEALVRYKRGAGIGIDTHQKHTKRTLSMISLALGSLLLPVQTSAVV